MWPKKQWERVTEQVKEHQLKIKTKCFHLANDYWRTHELNHWKLLPGWLSLSQTKPGLTEKVWMPFLEGFKPEKLWQNLKPMTTELFYSHILNMSRSSLHTRRFRRKYLSGLKCRLTKNGFADPKKFCSIRETGPSTVQERCHDNCAELMKKSAGNHN